MAAEQPAPSSPFSSGEMTTPKHCINHAPLHTLCAGAASHDTAMQKGDVSLLLRLVWVWQCHLRMEETCPSPARLMQATCTAPARLTCRVWPVTQKACICILDVQSSALCPLLRHHDMRLCSALPHPALLKVRLCMLMGLLATCTGSELFYGAHQQRGYAAAPGLGDGMALRGDSLLPPILEPTERSFSEFLKDVTAVGGPCC